MKLGAVPEWFQMCQTWFFDELRLYDVRLVDFSHFQRGGSRAKTTSGLLPPSLKHTVPTWNNLRQSKSKEKTPPSHREPLQNATSGLLPPRWKTVEMYTVSLKKSESVEKTRRRVTPQTRAHRRV